MNIAADSRALVIGVIQILGNLGAGIVLEQLGIRPLHAAFGEQSFRDFRIAAEAFEQKKSFREFFLHAGNDVLPGGGGNL